MIILNLILLDGSDISISMDVVNTPIALRPNTNSHFHVSSVTSTLWMMLAGDSNIIRILFLFLSLETGAYGQWRDLQFDAIGQKEGYLAQGIHDMAQDSLGFMYLATEMGLLRYDGSEFEYFQYDPEDSTSISEGQVNCMTFDKDGMLWLGMKGTWPGLIREAAPLYISLFALQHRIV